MCVYTTDVVNISYILILELDSCLSQSVTKSRWHRFHFSLYFILIVFDAFLKQYLHRNLIFYCNTKCTKPQLIRPLFVFAGQKSPVELMSRWKEIKGSTSSSLSSTSSTIKVQSPYFVVVFHIRWYLIAHCIIKGLLYIYVYSFIIPHFFNSSLKSLLLPHSHSIYLTLQISIL